jgi:alginate O-acetyltransferase complex protein AlgI
VLFNSYQFVFVFLPLVLIGFAILTSLGPRRAVGPFLIVASLFFYGWWNWWYLFLFGFSIVFNYRWSLLLLRSGRPAGAPDTPPRPSRLLLATGIAVNLALLGFFKYRNFLVASVAGAIGTPWNLPPLVLPLAVSFFTFEQITYLVSAYRGEPGTGDFISYCMFITFFPHLIAGPIVRYSEIYPQFNRESSLRLDSAALADGLMIFSIGLFKKVILADTLREIVNPLFGPHLAMSFPDAWGAALSFALQIYFDFSGYSDMAIGLARMFGVRFPENFDSPYQAQDIIQFWRRWHMTLSFFLRDYLYIPLGGNRRGEPRRYLNLFLTMLLGGLWHGANWTFVVWGGLHGFFLAINHLWIRSGRRLPTALAWILTFLLVTVAWVFFRATSFGQAALILKGMAGLSGFAWDPSWYSVGWHELRQIAIGLVLVLFCPNRQTLLSRAWKSDYVYAGAFALLAGLSIMSMANPPPFIYFQF